jgi:hypothetical protein
VFPGPVLLSQRSVYGCAHLLAARGLPTDEYLAEGAYTGEADWNKGERYVSCLLRRSDGKAMPSHALVDPGRTVASDAIVNLRMMSLDLAHNPPPGSCIATRTSYDDHDGRADFVTCAVPHWGEIIGYPVLYGPGSAWPGDDAVSAAATAACDALFRKRGPGDGYEYVISWPAKEFWTDGPDTRKYAACVVRRSDDRLTSGALT